MSFVSVRFKVFRVSRARWLVMVLAPAPIVAGSIAVSNLARSERAEAPATNDVLPAPAAPRDVQLVTFLEESAATSPVDDEKLRSACAARGFAIREQLGEQCNVIVEPPFVIAGDLSQQQLERWHEQTIQPAAKAMAHRYFRTPPSEPVTVLLFNGRDCYEHFAEKLYRDRGISIYGYYKPRERTLVMNIATGGGTLVHELTHALIAFDCPRVPDWFNEGLASLHEQCRFRHDDDGPWIEGLPNWRLARLQQEVAAGRVAPLRDLLRDDDFRGEREALNYAQARYFCMFMQQRGVLDDFYAALRTNITADPHGEQAVSAVFPDQSWDDLDAAFQKFVLELKTK